MATAGLAAALAVLAFTWHFTLSPAAQWKTFSTAIGEQRAIGLEDGSIVHLNTQSRVQVSMSAKARGIRLVEGEALFKVHRDPARPFQVYTSDAVIQAVGTQFNVYRRPEGTMVSVLEGRVQVSADGAAATAGTNPAAALTSLGAGEEAKIRRDGAIDRGTAPDVENLAAWRQRRLVFKQAVLADVVMEFNRYNRAPRFRVKDAALAARLYSGVFDADDPQSLTELLAKENDIALERRGDEIVIQAR